MIFGKKVGLSYSLMNASFPGRDPVGFGWRGFYLAPTVGIVALGAIHAGVKSFFTIPVRALFIIGVIGP